MLPSILAASLLRVRVGFCWAAESLGSRLKTANLSCWNNSPRAVLWVLGEGYSLEDSTQDSTVDCSRIEGTTNMGSGLFLVSKKHYLPETIRNIQREQKKHIVPILWQQCHLNESYPCFSKVWRTESTFWEF